MGPETTAFPASLLPATFPCPLAVTAKQRLKHTAGNLSALQGTPTQPHGEALSPFENNP